MPCVATGWKWLSIYPFIARTHVELRVSIDTLFVCVRVCMCPGLPTTLCYAPAMPSECCVALQVPWCRVQSGRRSMCGTFVLNKSDRKL